MGGAFDIVDAYSIENAIPMLREHLGEEAIGSLLNALESLLKDPHDRVLVAQLAEVFDGLGSLQGAVLTYAPCIAIIVSDNPFKEPD